MKQAYTVNEIIAQGVLGRTKLYEEIAVGRIKAKKIGVRTIVLAEDWRAFLDNLPDCREAA